MVNSSSLDPQVIAAKEIVKGLKELKPVTREILEQFGISKDNNFEGLLPLIALVYPEAKSLALFSIKFAKNLLVLEGQIMNYLETIGNDLNSAVKTVNNVSSGLTTSGDYTIGVGGII